MSKYFSSQKVTFGRMHKIFIEIIYHFISDVIDYDDFEACKTVSGPDANKPCIFPFGYNGVTYNKCIVTNVREAKLLTELGLWTAYDFSWSKFQTPWCASKVDDQGRLVRGNNTNLSRHITACSQDCPFDDGKGKKNSTYQIKLKRFIGYKSVAA